MKRLFYTGILIIILTLSLSNLLEAASIEKAILLNEHGLINEAKKELIEIIFDRKNNETKAHAYYLLGNIAFDSNQVNLAVKSWSKIIEDYPKTSHASLVKDQVEKLSEAALKISKTDLDNTTAILYLKHADFWSKDKSEIFMIDSSWIPEVESAIKWYDKVISEFPGTAAAQVAYEGKLRTLLGWTEGYGRDKESYGMKRNFRKYLPMMLKSFESYEKDFPNAILLQNFRYQIAQSYWVNREWDKTREWLQKIIVEAGDTDSFYKDLAERRLKKVEY